MSEAHLYMVKSPKIPLSNYIYKFSLRKHNKLMFAESENLTTVGSKFYRKERLKWLLPLYFRNYGINFCYDVLSLINLFKNTFTEQLSSEEIKI